MSWLEFRTNPPVAFAHCTLADFGSERHMTASVAVLFGKHFGKPSSINCIDFHQTFQKKNKYDAGVIGLVTKVEYWCEPKMIDYDIAFQQFIYEFKEMGYKHLICSPMGCVKNKIELCHFISNLMSFQSQTNASVDIVLYDQKSFRKLFNGLHHGLFLEEMHKAINEFQHCSMCQVFSSPQT